MKTLFLDIETAPHKVYAWGLYDQDISISQIVEPGYTLCWAAKWAGEDEVLFGRVYGLPNRKSKRFISSARTMVRDVHALLNKADAVVHYNGQKFDVPTLNKEFLLFGLNPPAPYKQIDLLQTARREFRLASNKLDYVAQALGEGAKTAHKGMEHWTACMAGDPEAWALMETYNKNDVSLTERVYQRLLPWIKGHPNAALYMDSSDPVCPTCGSKLLQARGTAKTATLIYQRFQCKGCGKWSRARQNLMSKERKASVLVAA